MIIYRCVITDDEMFSDIYKIKEVCSGVLYEVEGKSVTRTDTFDDSLIGANASAEEAQDCNADSSVSGVDIVLNHKLQETSFNKASYKAYIKDYVKALKAYLEEHHPERVEVFVKESPNAVKRLLSDFKDFQFYTGERMDPGGGVGLLDYREDGVTPYMLFFKDGLKAEKC